jgi:hypothetical protein
MKTEPLSTLEKEAKRIILANLSASTSLIQRHLKLGYGDANLLLKRFEGYLISQPDANGLRSLLPNAVDITHGKADEAPVVIKPEEVARPIPNSYWVKLGSVMAGEYPGNSYPHQTESRINRFLSLGVNAFLDLTQEDELDPYEGILKSSSERLGVETYYRRMSIRDMDIPASNQVMVEILNQIDQWVMERRKIYIHCWGGIGRTGTVVGCYLVSHGLQGSAALKHVQLLYSQMSAEKIRHHPESPQTIPQKAFVRNWDADAGVTN